MAREHPGVRLRELREAKKLSTRALGKLVGVAGATISRIERGESWARPSTLESIERILGPVDMAHDDASQATGIPLDARISPTGTVSGPTLLSLQSPHLTYAKEVAAERIAASGAGEGWFGGVSDLQTPAPVPRDPSPDGGPRAFDLWRGDVLVFRPLGEAEAVPHDAIVIVEMDLAARDEDPQERLELRLARRELGRVTLYPLLPGVDHEPLRKGWRVLAVLVEQRRRG